MQIGKLKSEGDGLVAGDWIEKVGAELGHGVSLGSKGREERLGRGDGKIGVKLGHNGLGLKIGQTGVRPGPGVRLGQIGLRLGRTEKLGAKLTRLVGHGDIEKSGGGGNADGPKVDTCEPCGVYVFVCTNGDIYPVGVTREMGVHSNTGHIKR